MVTLSSEHAQSCDGARAAAQRPGVASGGSGQLALSSSGADAGAWPLGGVGPTIKKGSTEPRR